jgi:hypothetical protein
MKKNSRMILCAVCTLVIAVISFAIHLRTLEFESSLALLPESREMHMLDDNQTFQKHLKLAHEGDLESVENVAVWYHLKGKEVEATFWDKRSDEIRVKLGLPSRDEILRKGLPRNSGDNYKAVIIKSL